MRRGIAAIVALFIVTGLGGESGELAGVGQAKAEQGSGLRLGLERDRAAGSVRLRGDRVRRLRPTSDPVHERCAKEVFSRGIAGPEQTGGVEIPDPVFSRPVPMTP